MNTKIWTQASLTFLWWTVEPKDWAAHLAFKWVSVSVSAMEVSVDLTSVCQWSHHQCTHVTNNCWALLRVRSYARAWGQTEENQGSGFEELTLRRGRKYEKCCHKCWGPLTGDREVQVNREACSVTQSLSHLHLAPLVVNKLGRIRSGVLLSGFPFVRVESSLCLWEDLIHNISY